jgi:hypothetical protein
MTTTTAPTSAAASSATSSSSIDMRLVAKGRRDTLASLLQQAKVSAGLAVMYAAPLDPCGWTAARTAAMQSEVASLETDVASRIDTANAARHATTQEHAAVDAAKAFIRKLRAAAPMAIRDTKVEGVPHNAFNLGGSLARSTPKIAEYLTKVRPIVVKLDDDFVPYFKGAKASAELDAVKAALDGADVVQETKLSALPQESLQVYETKGRILEAIEDLNRVAKIAFDGDAGTRSAFNKDILLRARNAAKAATTEPSAPSTSADKTATTSPGATPPAKDTKTATTSPGATPPAKESKSATLEPAHA